MNNIKTKKLKMENIFINTILTPITILKLIKKSIKIKNKKYINKFIKPNNYKNINKINTILINKKYIIKSKSKGKGFSGTIKKHKFKSNKATHGNSKAHNKPGSIGMCQTPGRLLKGKKMAGNLGNNTNTIKNISILMVKNNTIFIKGNIPGSNGTTINIKTYE